MSGGIFLRMRESMEASRARLTGTPHSGNTASKRATWRGRFAKAGIATLAGLMLATVAVTGTAVASVQPSSSIASSVVPAVVGATPESTGQGVTAFVDGAPTMQQTPSVALSSGITSGAGNRVGLGACVDTCGPYLSPEAQAERAAISDNLLLNRWRDATANFQNKYDMWAIGDLMNAASRTMLQGNIMAVGNGFWTVSQWVADLALNFEPINMLGAQMDQIGATLGKSMLNPSSGVALIPLILIVVVGIWMFASWRKSGPGASGMLFRRIAGLVATMAVFVVMVVGAQNSTSTANGQYKPGVGSPGWIVTIANDSLTSAATVPVGAVLATVQSQTSASINNNITNGTGPNNLCAETVNKYDEWFRNSAGSAALATPRIALVQTMDSMWRTTGLQVWKAAQLGTSEYADYSYCRLLDHWTQTPATNASSFSVATTIPASSRENGQLVWTASSAEQIQRAMVGWAGCEPTNRAGGQWQWRAGWSQLSNTSGDECQKWWNKKPGEEFEGGLSVGYTMNDVEQKTKDITGPAQARIQDYLASLNGANAAGNMFPLLMYAVSAFIMMCIFFGMALAVVVAKLFVVLGTITIMPIMILALFRTNGLEQLGAAAKQFIGSMLFAALSLVLLSVVVLTTYILVQFGNGSFGAGSIMALGWAAAAPVLAVISLNMIFKKVLKMPSPMSVKGGLAYGLASGAAGGAVGGFIGGRMARNAIERSGRSAIQGAGSSALSKVSGGRFGTTMSERRAAMGRGMLGPATPKKGAGTAAAGLGAPGTGAAGGAATAAAAGAAAGGVLGGKRAARQQAREDSRHERMAARVYASQQAAQARSAAGLGEGGTANGPRNLRAASADAVRNAWMSTKQNVAERRSELWNGMKATANTMRHPIQHIRGDDLREQFTDASGAFDEVGFRLARQDRIKADMKKAALGAAVVGGGVMTAGSSWVIGATAVGATYATAKTTGAAWGVTKRVASNVSGRDRMAAYRGYQAEQAVAQQAAEQETRRARRSGGSPARPRTPQPRTPVTGTPVSGVRPPLPPAPAASANPFATVADKPRILFTGALPSRATPMPSAGSTPQPRRVFLEGPGDRS